MTQEHIDELIAKCSKRKDIEMPLFPESPSKACAKQTAPANTVTPPPQNLTTQKNDLPKGLSNITPSPALVENETSKNVNKVAAKPSKVQLEIHRKWQAAAEAAGGPDARIVLSKPAAKKIIYDFLYDEFRPMNITEIHKVRKESPL